MTRVFSRRQVRTWFAGAASGALAFTFVACSPDTGGSGEDSGASSQSSAPAAERSDGAQSGAQSDETDGDSLANEAELTEEQVDAAVAAPLSDGRTLKNVPEGEGDDGADTKADPTGAAESDLPPEAIEPAACASILWRPHTFGGLSAQWPHRSLYLPQEGDEQAADMKGVFVAVAPSGDEAAEAVSAVEDLAAQCSQYTVMIGGGAPTTLTLSNWDDAAISQGWVLETSTQAEAAEHEVSVGARVSNVLISVGPQPADRLDEVKALVSQIAGQLTNQ